MFSDSFYEKRKIDFSLTKQIKPNCRISQIHYCYEYYLTKKHINPSSQLFFNNAFLLQDERDVQKHLWITSNQSNNQYSKLISFEYDKKRMVIWHFSHLEYLKKKSALALLLSRVTTSTRFKVYPPPVKDVRFGRSIYNHSIPVYNTSHCQWTLSTIPTT